MNAVAIVYPSAYNVICEFLGANWYALVASIGLAVLFIIHICYAIWLTLQNRKARGNDQYKISKRPASVEWSSQNMLVLGIVVFAFLIVHLIQFWAKMQLQEIRGVEGVIPPSMGTLFIQEAFSCIWTPIIYIIGFVALWFHMNHGFWSMFQSIGWNNNNWLPRLKTIACWWTTIVVVVFVAQAIVFSVQAHSGFYKNDPTLREQYKSVIGDVVGIPADRFGYEDVPSNDDLTKMEAQLNQIKKDPNLMQQYGMTPALIETQFKTLDGWKWARHFVDYLDGDKCCANHDEAVESVSVEENIDQN
jgi:succinate dehydrogenase / fumarate reductase cytochrome b subunit